MITEPNNIGVMVEPVRRYGFPPDLFGGAAGKIPAGILPHAARDWLGTPFRQGSRIPGPQGGVDCIHLVIALYAACGLVLETGLTGYYAMDEGEHRTAEPILKWLRQSKEFRPVWERASRGGGLPLTQYHFDRFAAGDLLCFRIGRSVHHLGVALSPREFLHALRGTGAVIARLDDHTFGPRLAAVWRPLLVQGSKFQVQGEPTAPLNLEP